MSAPVSLSAVFSAHCASRPAADLDAELRSAWERSRARWPGVEVPAADFVAYLAARTPQSADGHADPASLALEDLYLACACAAGNEAALQMFDSSLLSQVPAFVSQLRLADSELDELRQHLRERLLVATADQPPRLAEYSGKGSLAAFLRVAAVRQALNLRRGKAQAPHDDDDTVARLASPDQSPEAAYLRERYAPEFRNALRSAMSELTPEEHNLLHLYFVGGVNMAQLAQMFKVNRTTIGRWLQEAREKLNSRARKKLKQELRITETQLESLYQALASQIDLSLPELFSGSAPRSP